MRTQPSNPTRSSSRPNRHLTSIASVKHSSTLSGAMIRRPEETLSRPFLAPACPGAGVPAQEVRVELEQEEALQVPAGLEADPLAR